MMTFEALENSDETRRMEAVLDNAGDPSWAPAFFDRLLREPSRAVSEALCHALDQSRSPQVLSRAVEALASSNAFLRARMVELLGGQAFDAAEFLARAMGGPNRHVRKLILDVLSNRMEPEFDSFFQAGLLDEDPNVVITAVEYIGRQGRGHFAPQLETLLRQRPDPMLRMACLEALGQVGNAQSLQIALEALGPLDQMDDLYTFGLVKLMAHQGTPQHLASLGQMLKLRGRHLVMPLLDALLQICARNHLEEMPEELLLILEKLLAAHPDVLMAYQILTLLGRMAPNAQVRGLLEAMLRSPEKILRIGALEALITGLGNASTPILLEQARHEEDPEVLMALHEALDRLALAPENRFW